MRVDQNVPGQRAPGADLGDRRVCRRWVIPVTPPGASLQRSPGAGFRALALIGPGASTRRPIVPRTSGRLDDAAYDAAIRRLIERGAALDEQGIYLLARLSPRYPTVEIRVADTCLDAGTAVLLAGLTRALVATALAEARQHAPQPAAPARHVNAALAAAARHGLTGPAIDPFNGQPADARSVRSRLLDHLYPALSEHGDAPIITGLLRRLDQDGTGADRQRALFTSGLPPPGFVNALARATLSHSM